MYPEKQMISDGIGKWRMSIRVIVISHNFKVHDCLEIGCPNTSSLTKLVEESYSFLSCPGNFSDFGSNYGGQNSNYGPVRGGGGGSGGGGGGGRNQGPYSSNGDRNLLIISKAPLSNQL